MKIKYDREANALYITLRETEVADTREITADLIVDFDSQMRPVGIELLHVSDNLGPGALTRLTVENLLPEADAPLLR